MNLVALDLDGTLEDSRADMVDAVHRVRAAYGVVARDDEAVRPHVNRGMPHLYRACFDDCGDVDAVRAAYTADYLAHIADSTRLYDGIAGALPRLAEMATLVVVTNKPEALSEALLEALGVRGHFACVMGGDSTAEPKPSPLSLRTAAERLGFDARVGRAVMVGDSAGDVKVARAFGAASVWCAWGYVEAPGVEPDAVARHPADLPGVVAGLLPAR